MPLSERPIRMRVHERDDLRIDGILRLIETSSAPGPVSRVLQRMCEHVAAIAHADVVSVYVREHGAEHDELVLRATVGFPATAIGQVRLAMGEGITGTAAEVMRPISASVAQQDEHYKHVPGLDEERFPSLVAIPLVVSGTVEGVLVLQRGEAHAFTETEVALATALATTFAGALQTRADASRTLARSARLSGHALCDGVALGRALMLGTLEALRPQRETTRDPAAAAEEAFATVASLLDKGRRRVENALAPPELAALVSIELMLEDQRLRTYVREACGQHGVVSGLKRVAREYAATPYASGTSEPLLEQRAIELEKLCLLIASVAIDLPLPNQGEVLVVAERLTAMGALAAVGGRASGVVAGGPLDARDLGVAIARVAGLPVLADVGGLFAWVRPDDTLLIDCNQGLLRVNPPATTIARYRRDDIKRPRATPSTPPREDGEGGAEGAP